MGEPVTVEYCEPTPLFRLWPCLCTRCNDSTQQGVATGADIGNSVRFCVLGIHLTWSHALVGAAYGPCTVAAQNIGTLEHILGQKGSFVGVVGPGPFHFFAAAQSLVLIQYARQRGAARTAGSRIWLGELMGSIEV